MILGFLYISSEKGGIWRLCGDLKKNIGEPSPKVATLRSDDVPIFISPTSRRCDFTTSLGLNQQDFFRYKVKSDEFKGGDRRERIEKTAQA